MRSFVFLLLSDLWFKYYLTLSETRSSSFCSFLAPFLLMLTFLCFQHTKRTCSVEVWCTKIAYILRIVVQTGTNLDKHHVLIVIDLILDKMGERLCNGDFSFSPVPLVSSVTNQSKLLKSLLVGGRCLDKVMFCLKPFDFNDFSLKLTKYLMLPNSHLCVKI